MQDSPHPPVPLPAPPGLPVQCVSGRGGWGMRAVFLCGGKFLNGGGQALSGFPFWRKPGDALLNFRPRTKSLCGAALFQQT